ncbi:MAG TPA: ABC transporter ATP-binding protein [Acidimicrobiales bacterium]|nr:ABC transporter ATP-binding protein [Acidimicrobiales bacterium]
MGDAAIAAVGLSVRYGSLEALRDVDLRVERGEVVALLGPNGAGKTTCVETLLGYRRPTEGRATVLGLDPVADHAALVPRLGAMLQQGGVWPAMRAGEALRLVASYYDDPEDPDRLVERLDLGSCASRTWRRLSGGEQQRLSLAIALLPRPEALFLDEPTAGVDPVGRRVIRDVIADARHRGAAVLLTTHDLADVEAAADRAVVLHEGRVRADGSVAELTKGGTTFESRPGLDLASVTAAVGAAVAEGPPGTYRVGRTLDAAATAALATALGSLGAPLDALRQGTTLEERYLAIVGPPGAPSPSSATPSAP